MADWSIDPGFHEEPTHVPTGDECEAWLRSDLCSHSDCRECGAAVAKHLRAEARAGFSGLMRLAREVGRVSQKYGSNVPDGPVVAGDVAQAHPHWSMVLWRSGVGRGLRAWADGLVDGVSNSSMPATARECFPAGLDRPAWVAEFERWCYFLGRVAPALHRLHSHLRQREAQAMADAQEVR